jgi:hypothetical protein
MRKARCPVVKGEGDRTARLLAQPTEKCIGKITSAYLECRQGSEDFELILNNENRGLKQAFNDRRKLLVGKSIGSLEHPCRFDHGDDAHEARIVFIEAMLDQFDGPWRLYRIVLGEVTHQDVGIEPDHCRLRRGNPSLAPAKTAARISSIVTGSRRGLLSIPRRLEIGRVGSGTTLPSGWMKNLTLSPGFSPR